MNMDIEIVVSGRPLPGPPWLDGYFTPTPAKAVGMARDFYSMFGELAYWRRPFDGGSFWRSNMFSSFMRFKLWQAQNDGGLVSGPHIDLWNDVL